ncbi:MAG: hypothetical protein KKH98_12740 [Spirochaetes bacterium]|nr:hypothetical protein [Spirochaetota bacterium]
MSFKESELSNIIKILDVLNKKYRHPSLSQKLIESTIQNYQTIPVYPGLVANTLSRMVGEADHTELKHDDWIAFIYKGKKYSGRVNMMDKDQIMLKEIIEISEKPSLSFKKNELDKIVKVTEDQLKKDWPMLIFDGERNAKRNIKK